MLPYLLGENALMLPLNEHDHTFGYERGNSSVEWDVSAIWDAVEHLPVVKIPISMVSDAVMEASKTWKKDDWERVKEADLSYPPIVSSELTQFNIDPYKVVQSYLIIDGYHRTMKAIKAGHKELEVKMISVMPAPKSTKGTPFKINGLNFNWR